MNICEKSNSVLTGIVLLLFAVAFLLAAERFITNAAIDYDEGYNLQVSANLARGGVYATYSRLLDPYISTGPTVLIPAAALISNHYPLLPRVIPFFYSCGILLLLHAFVYGTRTETITLFVVAALTPLYLFFSTHILGEIPGFFLLLVAYVFFSKGNFLACGTALGLSSLTKSIYLIGCLPVLMLYAIDVAYGFYFSTPDGEAAKALVLKYLKQGFKIFLGTSAVMIGWEIYRLYAFDFDLDEYVQNLLFFKHLAASHVRLSPALFIRRMEMMHYVFYVEPLLCLLFYVVFVVVLLAKVRATPGEDRNSFILLLLFFSLSYLAYFMLFDSTNWYRHMFPFVLSVVSLVPPFLVESLKKLNKASRLTRCAVLVFLMVVTLDFIGTRQDFLQNESLQRRKTMEQNLIFDEGMAPLFGKSRILIAQQEVASFLNEDFPRAILSGYDWWRAPEISYLIKRPIGKDVRADRANLALTHLYGKMLAVEQSDVIDRAGWKNVFHNDYYDVYAVPPER